MTNFQIKRGSKKGLPTLLTGEFGLVTDQSDEELYIGGNSRNRRIALLSDEGTLPETLLKNSGVNAGTYKAVTVNAKGIVTGGSNPTTLSGYGITDAYSKTETDSKISTAANKSLSASYNSATEELTLSIS